MCRSIENAKSLNIHSKTITLHNVSLSPSDMEFVTVFLTCSSHKKWRVLDLFGCFIHDHGVHILHRGLTNCAVTIVKLRLRFNGLTESSSSAISGITISGRVKELHISCNNTVGEDERLYSIISDPLSVLEELHMHSTKLSSNAATKLFVALSNSKKLKISDIACNLITDEACDAIIMAMNKNISLIKLDMRGNPISEKYAQLIVQAMQHNKTLQLLWLPSYQYSDDAKEKIRLLAEKINEK